MGLVWSGQAWVDLGSGSTWLLSHGIAEVVPRLNATVTDKRASLAQGRGTVTATMAIPVVARTSHAQVAKGPSERHMRPQRLEEWINRISSVAQSVC